MWLEILFIVLGFLLLIKGGDILVDSASEIARFFGISELAIGLTIVAFGTSAPELMVSLQSSYNGLNDFVFGNVLGSNILNILLGLGIAGIILPLKVQKSTVKYEIPFLVIITLILSLQLNDQVFGESQNVLTRRDGFILILLFVVFLTYTYKISQDENGVEAHDKPSSILKPILLFLLGCVALKYGSEFVVDNAEVVGKQLQVPDAIIGLTVLAIGTSLPELVVSISAVRKGSTDIAVGGMVGSNIFNTLLVLGISSLVNPIAYSRELNIDLLLTNICAILLLIFIFFGSKHLLSRRSSILFIVIYSIYSYFRFVG